MKMLKLPHILGSKCNFNFLQRFCVISDFSYTSRNVSVCWKCGTESHNFLIFCAKCNVIQKPLNKGNYFKILDINETFDVDLKMLTKKYRGMQSVLHPDKYSTKSTEEKSISEDYSSAVNAAYNTISTPIKRGLHLLSLKGEKIDDNEDKNTDKAFLMEIMELNEEVEDAETPEQLVALNNKNKKELENIVTKLSQAFKQNDVLLAKRILIRMKYFTSISLQINGILREKGIIE